MSEMQTLSPKGGDDLDGLLRAFFRQQMPRVWPASPVPSSDALVLRRPPSGYGQMRSRWTLAAAIVLLLLGSLLLPRRFTSEGKPEPSLGGLNTANTNILPPQPKHHEGKPPPTNHNRPGFGIEDGDLLPDLDDSGLLFPK